MWEQIRGNKRKSMVLVFFMALLLLALGFTIGMALTGVTSSDGRIAYSNPGSYAGGIFGLMVAMIIWLVMTIAAFFGGDKILLASNKAHEIQKSDHPQLYNVVEEMVIASGIGKMPKVYIIDDMSPNAFATGRSPDHAAVAVTAGLLAKLNRDELQGVIAHEMSHIINRDVLFMTMIGVMVGSIAIMSELFVRSLWFGAAGRRRSRYESKGGGQAQLILLVVGILMAILAPILAQIIYFAASRRREYLADANAALMTRYPEGLASALETISHDPTPLAAANKASAPMYIANPMKKRSLKGLTSTHPPIVDRVRILRSMGGNASYGAYQQAWKTVGGKGADGLPASALAGSPRVPVRQAHSEAAAEKRSRAQLRQATDAIRNANKYMFLACACGLQMKLPPNFKHDHVKCPRCSRDVAVPVAQMAAIAQVTDALAEQTKAGAHPSQKEQLEIVRDGKGWTTFRCPCGGTVNVSPNFAGTHAVCGKCGRKIAVRNA